MTRLIRFSALIALAASVLAGLALLLSAPAHAQAFPQRPVRLILPFPAGGPSDVAARALGRVLEKSWGQPVIIDNRPGANGAIAAKAAAGAAPDGHTLLWAVGSTLALPYLQEGEGAAAVTGLVPVASIGRFGFGLFVSPRMSAGTLAEFVAEARANPEKLTVATSNLAEFMAVAQFMKATGTRFTRVPYKGSVQVMPDLLEGRVQASFMPLAAGLEQVRAGKLRLLASLLPARTQAVAEVPTMQEAGLGSVSVSGWQFLFAPPQTPQARVAEIARAVQTALDNAELRAQYDLQLLQIEAAAADGVAAIVAHEMRGWEQFAREQAVRLE